ncbi:hypothetical protein CEXT_618871 [Caerostris extrusa]|uniref:Uncharacterized protein n=1 Tax=Caerostris extrusa TaxID=172846 RepID=A0AAV4S924_CAEEX|nr:hypothetical protein CEXT_618871 [Caerostris extrusa]
MVDIDNTAACPPSDYLQNNNISTMTHYNCQTLFHVFLYSTAADNHDRRVAVMLGAGKRHLPVLFTCEAGTYGPKADCRAQSEKLPAPEIDIQVPEPRQRRRKVIDRAQ